MVSSRQVFLIFARVSYSFDVFIASLMDYRIVSADEAANLVHHGDVVAFSGFTAAGCPKEVPSAIARRAEQLHTQGKPFRISVITGASSGDAMDGALARAGAIDLRLPYQNVGDMRSAINEGQVRYIDMHLSEVAQQLRYGFLPRPRVAIVEASSISSRGEIVPTYGVGILPTICRLAEKIIVELNVAVPEALRGLHDIAEPTDPPHRQELPIYSPSDRIGSDCVRVDPAKIACVVITDRSTEVAAFNKTDEVTAKIAQNVAQFLEKEMHKGRLPKEFLPIQSGVGNVANAILKDLGNSPVIPPFEMYTEVIQDSVIDLIKWGRIRIASGSSLTCSAQKIEEILAALDFFRQRLVLRPTEYSNSPEIIRRLGVISINTALEADLMGAVNSSHVLGQRMVNGIGGSCDFTRNAFLSIFTTPSVAKDGAVSCIVPLVAHQDQSEHSVKVLVTEYGVADLRGLPPRERAEIIIDQCAHPDYRPLLRRYLDNCPKGHAPFNPSNCFAFHQTFAEKGDMRKQ